MEINLTRPSNTFINIDSFDESERQQIDSIKNSIDINNEKGITGLGSEASKAISSLNRTVLATVKVKDIPEIETMLPELSQAFKEVDSSSLLTKKQGFFSRTFKLDPVKDFVQKFESAEAVVGGIQHNLQKVSMELRKDIEMEENLGRQNITYIRELEKYIVAMRMKLEEEVQRINEKVSTTNENDFVALQLLEEEKDKVTALDNQVYWLEQQRLLAVQTLPILRNLKNNNRDMVRQIEMTIQQSIPAWEQGIIIAFHIHRQQGALRIERAVHDMTNNLVLQNSKLLKENSVEIAKAVQGGMIDMETFREANKNIIEASKKMTEVKNNAIKSRAANIEEYRKLTNQLIDAERRDITALSGTGTVGALYE